MDGRDLMLLTLAAVDSDLFGGSAHARPASSAAWG